MSRHSPIPVRLSDARCGYRAGSATGFALSLVLLSVVAGYAGIADAAPTETPTPHATPDLVRAAPSGPAALPRAATGPVWSDFHPTAAARPAGHREAIAARDLVAYAVTTPDR